MPVWLALLAQAEVGDSCYLGVDWRLASIPYVCFAHGGVTDRNFNAHRGLILSLGWPSRQKFPRFSLVCASRVPSPAVRTSAPACFGVFFAARPCRQIEVCIDERRPSAQRAIAGRKTTDTPDRGPTAVRMARPALDRSHHPAAHADWPASELGLPTDHSGVRCAR